MAHFAQIDDSNIVVQIIVVADSDAPNEAAGIAFCQSLLGADTNWVQTSYNNNIRTRYAAIGYTYDSSRDAFIPPKPYASWVINESTKNWEAPVSKPDDYQTSPDGPSYKWNESTTAWESI